MNLVPPAPRVDPAAPACLADVPETTESANPSAEEVCIQRWFELDWMGRNLRMCPLVKPHWPLILGLYFAWGASAQNLERDRPLQGTLKSAEIHSYYFPAATGQYFRVLVRPNGSPLSIRLIAPSGAGIATVLNIAGELRELLVSGIADVTGMYELELSLTDPNAPRRSYAINLTEIRAATEGDGKRIGAERAFQQAKQLQAQGSKEALQQAIAAFESALPLWRAVADQTQEGRTFDAMGDTYWSLGQPPKAKECFTQALSLAKASNDQLGEASALNNLGVTAILADPKKALGYLQDSLPLSRAADPNLQAYTLSNMGAVYLRMGDPRKALEYATRAVDQKREAGDRKGELSFLTNLASVYSALGDQHRALDALRETLPIQRQWHDQRGEAHTLFTMATAFFQLGEPDKALEFFQQLLPLRRAVGDRIGEAQALQNMGVAQMALGSLQEALTTFQTTLPISQELKDRHLEESLLTNTARAYLQLGEPQEALDFASQALRIQRQISDKRGEAVALGSLGSVFSAMGESQKALEFYQEALPLLRDAGDRAGEADILGVAGLTLLKLDAKAALSYFEQELERSREVGDRRREAVALVNAGSAYLALGERQKASETLDQGLAQLVTIGDRIQQARALGCLARLERDREAWDRARERLEEALHIDEQIRAEMIGPELRSSYFATVADQYEMLIDVLMRLHKLHPDQGFDVQAFETSERARARSLLDLLGGTRTELRQGADPALLQRERILTAQLHAKTERQIDLLAAKRADPRVAGIEADIRRLTTEYQEVESKILSTSPKYAAFAQRQPLALREIQEQFANGDTVLLEYATGEARSFVWAVTSTTFHAFELPKRSVLEAAARRASEGIAATDLGAAREATGALKELSLAVLAPLAGELGAKPLVIVTQGALQYVPFAALPSPSSPNEPLVVSHEIVNLPSASTIAFVRRELAKRPRAPKVLAVLADPVFNADDPRVPGASRNGPSRPSAAAEAERSASGFDRANFERLPSTRKEGLDILGLVPRRDSLSALDFNASRVTATSGVLNRYRLVHIASHGLLNTMHPELSGIVLSLVDRAGRAQNGFLQTTDIYNLKLNADLVVLSACQTALGKEVRGEGLVGLTRAFMYAGTPRVVASLWTVPDVSTAELMTQFYRGMLVNGLRPSAALRQAQISIWKEQRWARPYYWAAFTLQGEWR
jgi:CHAT domain-containing protein/Tfp pilus assembly protein PilF